MCGPMTPTTHDGNSYFVTFIEDFSHLRIFDKKEVKYFKNYEKERFNRIVVVERA